MSDKEVPESELSKKRTRGLDAYEPSQVAERVLRIGVKKTRYPAYKTFVLGLMGGGNIVF